MKALYLFLEHIVGTHTTQGEIPYSLLILRTVGMGVKVAWPTILLVFQKLYQEEHALDILASKSQVLIKTRPFLVIQINMEEHLLQELVQRHAQNSDQP